MGSAVGEEEQAARQRRLRIIILVVVALLVASSGFDFYVDRWAEEAQSSLRRMLNDAAQGLDHEMVLATWYEFLANPESPTLLDESLLPAEDQIALRAEGETVIAVYKAGFAGQDRCFDLLIGAANTEINERSC